MKKLELSLLITVLFAGGWALGYAHRASMSESAERLDHLPGTPGATEIKSADRLVLTQSSAAARTVAGVPLFAPETLADPQVRASLENNLRTVPYAVLKQIYLERQDQQWERQQARYAQPKVETEEEIERRSNQLFETFKRNSGGNSYYVSRGDLKLRGGKNAPYILLVEYYSSGSENAWEPNAPNSPSGQSASSGKELCYISTLYIQVSDKYAADGQSTCLNWVSTRGERPYAVHSNQISKHLLSYFDSLSVALPGFGGDVNSEWYDATLDRWTSVGRIRFDPVTKDEMASLSKETLVESN